MSRVLDFGYVVKPITLFQAFEASFDQACAELNAVDLNIARLKRQVAARFILRSYPHAAYIQHEDALNVTQPITQAYLVVTRPNGYTVHAVLAGRIGAVVEAINFEVQPARCPACAGEGRFPDHSGCGDQAGGYAQTCDACNGSGKRVLR